MEQTCSPGITEAAESSTVCSSFCRELGVRVAVFRENAAGRAVQSAFKNAQDSQWNSLVKMFLAPNGW
jgi:hypothetical protein